MPSTTFPDAGVTFSRDKPLDDPRRQQVEMLGWAVMVNALTMACHRAAEGLEAAA